MVCKAIIESKLTKYKVKVRIPSLHNGTTSIGAVATQGVPVATIAVPPGVYPSLKVGDIVFVAFEDDNIDKPVVLSCLFNDNCYNISNDAIHDSLEVKVNAKLPKDTQIGDITPTNIEQLKGLHSNVQLEFNGINNEIKAITDNGQGVHYYLLQTLNNKLTNIINNQNKLV